MESFKDVGQLDDAGPSFLAGTGQPIAQVDAQDGAPVNADISKTPNLVKKIARNNLPDPRLSDELDTADVDRKWEVNIERQVQEAADIITGASQECRGEKRRPVHRDTH